MYLHNGRNIIAKLFEKMYIEPTNFPHNPKLEPELEV